jgi:glycosyltransferase involved in cell wall biosynthesis
MKDVFEAPENVAAKANLNARSFDPANRTLSVILRCHRQDRLPLLDEALFSLAVQDWPAVEPVIVLQNGTESFKQAVAELIERFPWPDRPSYQILLVEIPPGVDGRSTLLTRGMEAARGRYLAFLDDDDYVYQHGYKLLIEQLGRGSSVVAAGGARTATMTFEDGRWFVVTKAMPYVWGRNKTDLFLDNFVPIHSYVIDRARVDLADLYFDDALPPLEDYEFLLRLAAKYEFDFTHLHTPVCEYRLHAGNSVPQQTGVSAEVFNKLKIGRQRVYERKQEIHLAVPLSQWVEWRRMIGAPPVEHRPYISPAPYPRALYKLADRIYAVLGRHPELFLKLGRLSRNARNFFRSLGRGSEST